MHVTTSNPLPNTPAKRILAQYSLHDSQVTFLGQYIYGRSIGAKMYVSNAREGTPPEELYGFEMIEDDVVLTEGSLLQGWDFGLPDVPIENIPPNAEDDTHELVRRTQNARNQMDWFFDNGGIVNTCGGLCVD
jgi:hypothetical protein